MMDFETTSVPNPTFAGWLAKAVRTAEYSTWRWQINCLLASQKSIPSHYPHAQRFIQDVLSTKVWAMKSTVCHRYLLQETDTVMLSFKFRINTCQDEELSVPGYISAKDPCCCPSCVQRRGRNVYLIKLWYMFPIPVGGWWTTWALRKWSSLLVTL